MLIVALGFLLAAQCAGVAAFIAYARGLPVSKFAVAGLFLSVFGIIWACDARVPVEDESEPAPVGPVVHV
jgi:hypothetical protein